MLQEGAERSGDCGVSRTIQYVCSLRGPLQPESPSLSSSLCSRLAAELSAVKGRSWPPGGDQAAAGRS